MKQESAAATQTHSGFNYTTHKNMKALFLLRIIIILIPCISNNSNKNSILSLMTTPVLVPKTPDENEQRSLRDCPW